VAGTAYRPVLAGCRCSAAIWAAEHALARSYDLVFAGYRGVSVLPFLAVWTALYYAFGRRLLPIMVARWVFNGGTALAVALNLV
jgi:hypothetical protein